MHLRDLRYSIIAGNENSVNLLDGLEYLKPRLNFKYLIKTETMLEITPNNFIIDIIVLGQNATLEKQDKNNFYEKRYKD